MAELSQKEKLQPSLLDRLTDDDPHHKKESRDKRVLSLKELRKSVIRDLGWLLNTNNLSSIQDLSEYPYVEHSVVNYGVPEFAGRPSSNFDFSGIQRLIRQAVWDFEPRILRQTVKINIHTNTNEMNHNALTFDVEGELWAQPVPEQIYLKTELDLETGDVKIINYQSPGIN